VDLILKYYEIKRWENMKVGILSDVHGNDVALQAVIDDLKKEYIEKVIYLGDLVAGGPNPKNSLELLKKLEAISWIKGNTDSKYEEIVDEWKLQNNIEEQLSDYYLYALKELKYEDIKYLIEKPVQESIDLEGWKVLCVHGSPRQQMEKMGEEIDKEKLSEIIVGIKEDIILCGHSHRPSIIEINGKTIVNVGSVGIPFDGDNRSS
jgi:putative phosphoesterase